MTTQSTIEFATNHLHHWFVASTNRNAVKNIAKQSKQFNINPTRLQEFKHREGKRYVVYFNQEYLSKQFYEWVCQNFTVQNQKRAKAAESIRERQSLDSSKVADRIRLNKFDVRIIKLAMIECIGQPTKILELFKQHNITIIGHASKHQCIELVLTLNVAQQVTQSCQKINKQRSKSVDVEVVLDDPFETAQVNPEDYVDVAKVDDIIDNALTILLSKNLLVAGQNSKASTPINQWTKAELMTMTKNEMRRIAKLDNIDMSGTSRLRKDDLARFISEAFKNLLVES